MRTILRWMAPVVALVAGLTFGAGTAQAGTATLSATVHAQSHASTSGPQPKDWWW